MKKLDEVVFQNVRKETGPPVPLHYYYYTSAVNCELHNSILPIKDSVTLSSTYKTSLYYRKEKIFNCTKLVEFRLMYLILSTTQ